MFVHRSPLGNDQCITPYELPDRGERSCQIGSYLSAVVSVRRSWELGLPLVGCYARVVRPSSRQTCTPLNKLIESAPAEFEETVRCRTRSAAVELENGCTFSGRQKEP
ncbi:hypothetical protein CUJ84_pRLN3000239 (plasmid) [Rhizobium leguminosarum]|uniref:Uncharacterized protein n=1 Tax=Rhizobium leguminosarum TaxID=384 RepID=A0A2K9ZGI1_RHILE|nr:hypothetical protein CUJ84_pRLN3000239 [Rhizobium leguminosarum]